MPPLHSSGVPNYAPRRFYAGTNELWVAAANFFQSEMDPICKWRTGDNGSNAQERYPKLTRNAARCLRCGDVIESKATHEWVRCSCGAVGVDGGLNYQRRTGFESDMKELSEFEDESHTH